MSGLLTDDDVLAIRIARHAGATGRELADQYGISPATVCDITKGRHWKHVGGPIVDESRWYTPPGELHHMAILTDAQVIRIRDLYVNGKSQTELGRLFSVTTSTIWKIVHRKNWLHI